MNRTRTALSLPLGLALLLAANGSIATASGQAAGQPDAQAAGEAEETFAGFPLYSIVKTESGGLSLTNAALAGFSPLAVVCPSGVSNCTVVVTISCQLWGINGSQAAQVQLDASAGSVEPNSLINVASNTGGDWASTYTVQFTIGLPSGVTSTMTPRLGVNFGSGTAGLRTARYDVLYLP